MGSQSSLPNYFTKELTLSKLKRYFLEGVMSGYWTRKWNNLIYWNKQPKTVFENLRLNDLFSVLEDFTTH